MKPKLLPVFVIIFFMCLNASAQITVNYTHLASVGALVKQTHDTTPAVSIFPGAPGSNQVWNFAALNNQKVDTFVFKDPAWTPYGNNFTTSNLAITIGTTTNEYALSTSLGLFVEGATARLSDPSRHLIKEYFTPHSRLMQWPSNYNTNFIDNYTVYGRAAFDQVPAYDSIRLKSSVKSNVLIDAWGNVQTPLGTFATLRIKRHIIKNDTVWIHRISPPSWVLPGPPTKDTTDHYTWWTNSATVGFPVVEMDYKPATNSVKNVVWLPSNPTPQAVIEAGDISTFLAYPNPANDYINLKMKAEDASTVAIMDITGRIVDSAQVIVDETTTINTEHLKNGIYFLVVSGKNGHITTEKFSIVR